jgi:hypothetical protein
VSRWWRAHASALDDPKVQLLSGDMFKAWFNVLCIASLHDGALPPNAAIAFALRKSEEATAKILTTLIERGLIDVTDDGMTPHNWSGRQYKSDVSNERVKRHRERQRNGECNVTETPSETEADTEQTKAKALGGAGAQKPKRKTALPKDWQATEEQLAYAADHGSRDPRDTAERFKLHHLSKGTLGADWDLGFQYWCRNEKKFNGFGSSESASDKRSREVDEAIERSKMQ